MLNPGYPGWRRFFNRRVDDAIMLKVFLARAPYHMMFQVSAYVARGFIMVDDDFVRGKTRLATDLAGKLQTPEQRFFWAVNHELYHASRKHGRIWKAFYHAGMQLNLNPNSSKAIALVLSFTSIVSVAFLASRAFVPISMIAGITIAVAWAALAVMLLPFTMEECRADRHGFAFTDRIDPVTWRAAEEAADGVDVELDLVTSLKKLHACRRCARKAGCWKKHQRRTGNKDMPPYYASGPVRCNLPPSFVLHS